MAKKKKVEEVKETEEVVEVEEVKAEKKGKVKTKTATGVFYAEDGYVVNPEGKVVSSHMLQARAEEIAKRFQK